MKKTLTPTGLLVLFFAGIASNWAWSQGTPLSYDGSSFNYSQNFDSLGTNSISWSDGTTLPGWYMAAKLTTYGSSGIPITVAPSSGANTSGNAYNMGVEGVNPVTDRALGWLPASNTSDGYTGVQIQNNSGQDYVGDVTLSLFIEQWSAKNATARVVNIDEKVVATSGDQLQSASWTTLQTVNSPNLTTIGAIDGNDPANRVAVNQTISFTSANPWLHGQYLWFRVTERSGTGGNDLMGVDDVNIGIQAVPEPAACSLALAGLLVYRGAARRKRF